MKLTWKPVLKILGVFVALAIAVVVGYQAAGLAGASLSGQTSASYGSDGSRKDMAYSGAGVAATPESVGFVEAPAVAPTAGDASTAQATGTDRTVISVASMSLRVEDIDGAISSVRDIATASGSEVSNLVMTSGNVSPQPMPLASDSGAANYSGPADAQVTLRVPADGLVAVTQRVAKLGVVLAQSSSQDDVTQQHVDMKARLKNLQAEEARLRSFLSRTNKVTELLDVERELSRVRGEIESMQAQLQYLERQAAMATLTISLSEPGPVVSPGSDGWGFGTAVTDGVRAAAALVRATITLAIPLALVVALGGLIVLIWRGIRRRRVAAPVTPESTEE